MKQLFFLLMILVMSHLSAFADGGNTGHSYFNSVVVMFNEGKYNNAKDGFQICIDKFSAVVSEKNCREYIRLCEEKIEDSKRKAAAERAAIERAAVAEREAKAKAIQKRVEDRLVRVESNAYLFGKEYDMHSAVKGVLSDAGFKLTDNTNASRWTVYITCCAYEDDEVPKTDLNGSYLEYWSGINARVKIVDDINDNIIYENEILDEYGNDFCDWDKSYNKAALNVYAQLKDYIGRIIVKRIK